MKFQDFPVRPRKKAVSTRAALPGLLCLTTSKSDNGHSSKSAFNWDWVHLAVLQTGTWGHFRSNFTAHLKSPLPANCVPWCLQSGPLLTAVARNPEELRTQSCSFCKSYVRSSFLTPSVLSTLSNFKKKVWKKDANLCNNWYLNIFQWGSKQELTSMVRRWEGIPPTAFIQHGWEFRLTHTKCWLLGCFFQA